VVNQGQIWTPLRSPAAYDGAANNGHAARQPPEAESAAVAVGQLRRGVRL